MTDTTLFERVQALGKRLTQLEEDYMKLRDAFYWHTHPEAVQTDPDMDQHDNRYYP